MKQPELGKKLTELRKAKGLTQEEVVERCNVSVRTIQRIENGEVEPRSYTVRTILSALGYNFDEIFTEETGDSEADVTERPAVHEVKQMRTELDPRATPITTRPLSMALISGFIYFLLTFPEAFAEYARFIDGTIIFGNTWYIILKVVLFASFIVFQLGFVLVGKLFDNYLLRISAMIHIVIIAGFCIYDVASINYPDYTNFVAVAAAMLYGSMGLLYGVSLIKLRAKLGRTALAAGALEILSGCIFFTVVLFPLADLISMFAELIELVILYKVIDFVRNREVSSWSPELSR